MTEVKSIWKKCRFKNGKDYELAIANDDGILVFRDSIFSAQFDNHKVWEEMKTEWNKCSLKPLLEKWWKDNAPDELKDNYKISIPEVYNIFPDKSLPEELKGKKQHWEIYKDWRNRIFSHHRFQRSTTIWTKTKHPFVSDGLMVVDSGDFSYDIPRIINAVVPCLIPIKRKGE